MSPIYYGTGSAARAAGNLDAYRESFRENVRTREVIDRVLSTHFDGVHLDPETLPAILAEADPDRVALVLANTMRWRDLDGRFDRDARAWAAGVRLPDVDPEALSDMSSTYACREHSTILNGLIHRFIRSGR